MDWTVFLPCVQRHDFLEHAAQVRGLFSRSNFVDDPGLRAPCDTGSCAHTVTEIFVDLLKAGYIGNSFAGNDDGERVIGRVRSASALKLNFGGFDCRSRWYVNLVK